MTRAPAAARSRPQPDRLGRVRHQRYGCLGIAGTAQHNLTHSPTWLRGIPPHRHLGVDPVTKIPVWGLLPLTRRRKLKTGHG